LEVFYMIRVKEWNYLRMVDFRLKGVGGKAPAKRVRTSCHIPKFPDISVYDL
jgi:hypothetical protein